MRKSGIRPPVAPPTPSARTRGAPPAAPATKPAATTSAGWTPRGRPEPAADKRPVTVYRVEGPENQRVSFGNGKPHVSKSFNSATNESKAGSYRKPMDYQDRAFLNFGDRPRAEEFLAVRHEQGHTKTVMKAFDVPGETFDKIRKVDFVYKDPDVRADVNKGDNQYGLNWKSLQTVNATAIPGSGRVERKTPDMIMHPEVSSAFQDLFKPK